MMTTRRFTVYGEPRGKARPRRVTRGGKTHTYTPNKTRQYEQRVRTAYIACYGNYAQLGGPIAAHIVAYFAPPKSASKARRAKLLSGWHTTRCDADNIAKIVLDSLNHIAYQDDSRVAELTVVKRYDDTPRVEVELHELIQPQEVEA